MQHAPSNNRNATFRCAVQQFRRMPAGDEVDVSSPPCLVVICRIHGHPYIQAPRRHFPPLARPVPRVSTKVRDVEKRAAPNAAGGRDQILRAAKAVAMPDRRRARCSAGISAEPEHRPAAAGLVEPYAALLTACRPEATAKGGRRAKEAGRRPSLRAFRPYLTSLACPIAPTGRSGPCLNPRRQPPLPLASYRRGYVSMPSRRGG